MRSDPGRRPAVLLVVVVLAVALGACGAEPRRPADAPAADGPVAPAEDGPDAPGVSVADAPAPCAPAEDAPSPVVLGTTDERGQGFLPLAGDQPLIAGAQGGFHVWLKLRLTGMSDRDVRVHRTARRVADGRLVLDTEGALRVGTAGADGAWETPTPVPTFMCPAPLGVTVQGQPLRLEATVLDPATGAVLGSAATELTPRCPEGDQLQHCLDICSG